METLLLASAALANLTFLNIGAVRLLQHNGAAKVLVQATRNAETCSLFLKDQVGAGRRRKEAEAEVEGDSVSWYTTAAAPRPQPLPVPLDGAVSPHKEQHSRGRLCGVTSWLLVTPRAGTV